LVHEKTTGNPFFAIQFLSELADEGLLEEQQEMYRATAKELEARGLLDPSEVPQSLLQMDLDLTDARWVDSDGELPKDAEPIPKDAIKLPPRVEWSE